MYNVYSACAKWAFNVANSGHECLKQTGLVVFPMHSSISSVFNIVIYKAISLHSGVITVHSGVRQLQLVPIIALSWTLGQQKWHRFCILQHNVQQTPAAHFIFVSCFWCCDHAMLRCASFGSEHHTTILAIQAHTLTDKWCGNVWVRKRVCLKKTLFEHISFNNISYITDGVWCHHALKVPSLSDFTWHGQSIIIPEHKGHWKEQRKSSSITIVYLIVPLIEKMFARIVSSKKNAQKGGLKR